MVCRPGLLTRGYTNLPGDPSRTAVKMISLTQKSPDKLTALNKSIPGTTRERERITLNNPAVSPAGGVKNTSR